MSLGSCRFQRIGGLAPMCHQAVAASVDWRTCTWPNAYDVPTMPQRLSRTSGARQRRRGRCTSSAIVSGGPRGADRLFRRGPIRSNHAAPTSTGLVEACTWPSAYGVPTGPSTSHYCDVARQRPVAGAPAAPVTVEGRGARTGFSDAVRQGPTTQPPLPSDWWRHARGHLWLGLRVLV